MRKEDVKLMKKISRQLIRLRPTRVHASKKKYSRPREKRGWKKLLKDWLG